MRISIDYLCRGVTREKLVRLFAVLKFTILLAVFALGFLPANGRAQTASPSKVAWCAAEGGSCSATVPSIIIFGSGTSAVGQYVEPGDIACKAETFGVAPADGATNQCSLVAFDQLSPCLADDPKCPLTMHPMPPGGQNREPYLVVYGAGKNWTAQIASALTRAKCDTASFGGFDPAPGQIKSCMYAAMPSKGVPSTDAGPVVAGSNVVPGSTISSSELAATMQWLVRETWGIAKMPICWKSSYDRGVGVLPDCGSQEKLAGLCYTPCSQGYGDNGTSTCLQTGCPSGYTDTGLLCHFNGVALIAYPTHWNPNVNCWSTIFGSFCVGGLITEGCPSNYHDNGAGCTVNVPPGMSGSPQDPTKGSYTRLGAMPTQCNSNRVFQAGLCYLTPRADYSCSVTSCTQQCASGTTDCGPGACAESQSSCGIAVTNMVLGPIQMVATIATAGTAGPALVAAKATAEAAEKSGDVLATGDAFHSAVEQAMDAAANDLASISSPYAEQQIRHKWGRGSANYKTIARTWGGVNLMMMIANTDVNLAKTIGGIADPTGTVATITAYANPPCLQHTPAP